MGHGRVYTATLDSMPVSGTKDLFELVPDASTSIELLEFYISQENLTRNTNTDIYHLELIVGHTTPGDHTPGDPAIQVNSLDSTGQNPFIGQMHKNFVTIATGGAPKTFYTWNWLNRIPFNIIFAPESYRVISPNTRMVIRISDIGISPTLSAILTFREYGGTKRQIRSIGQTSEIDTGVIDFFIRRTDETDSAFKFTISGGLQF